MLIRSKRIAAIFAATLVLAGCGAPRTAANNNPANQGPEQKIHLIWKQATNEWKVKLNGGGEEDPKTATTKLDKETGPTKFEVDIQGGGSSPPTFKADGLWVWEGQGQKSAPQQGINTTQILGPVITKDGKLVFWDLNQGDPVILNYSLQFNEAGVPPVDPIIDNHG